MRVCKSSFARVLLLLELSASALSFSTSSSSLFQVPHLSHQNSSPTLLSFPQTSRNFRKVSNFSHNSCLKCTGLSLPSNIINDSTLALSTVLLSSSTGMVCEKLKIVKSGVGTIVSLLVASIISNVRIFGFSIPTSSPIYDFCWSRLLPASLALVLISKSYEQSGEEESTKNVSGIYQKDLQREIVANCGIPFMIGSIGSILGCFIAASVMVNISQQSLTLSSVGMTQMEASIAAGCLCASYIGGSVNFFATANILSTQMSSRCLQHKHSSSIVADTISSMAAADLLVMALYFVGLTTMLSMKNLKQIFPGRILSQKSNYEINKRMDISTKNEKDQNLSIKFSSYVFIVSITLTIVEVANAFERKTSHILPGLGCAMIALLGTITNRILSKSKLCAMKRLQWCISDMNRVGPRMGDFCFTCLFSAIGVSANVKEALTQGSSSVIFALLALSVHLITTGLGSFLFMKIFRKPLALEEILVASNAAIGGASTAASFAGNIDERQIDQDQKRGLITAATLWGVIGYASATTIGVFVAKCLQP